MFLDLFGKESAEQVLRAIGELFIREFEGIGTYGCLGEDRFAYCIPRAASNPEAFFDKLNRALTQTGHDYKITVDIGVYRIEDYSLKAVQMCDRANMALESIKGKFHECCAYYDDSMLRHLLDEQEIVGDMNDALESRQFFINVQPIFSVSKERPVSGEVLVRWRRPEKGVVSPGLFIPIFEKNGFITKLDYFVWEEACKLLRAQIDANEPVIPLSVNVSRINFYNPNLCSVFKALTKKYSLDPRLLKLEITESAYTSNQQQLTKTIEELRHEGFLFLMDDFGSGYSSLNMLNDLPVDILKIDMRFVQGLEKSDKAGSVLSSIVRLANWLELTPIAEGVETREQLSFLKSIGCDCIQGYYFSKPLDTDAFRALLIDRIGDTFASSDENGKFCILRTPRELIASAASKASKVSKSAKASKEPKPSTDKPEKIEKPENLPDENTLMRVTNEMFSLLGDFAGAFGVYELNGNVLEAVRVNDAYYSLTGSTPEMLSRNGLNVISWLYEDDREKMLELLKRTVATGKAETACVRRYHQNGDLMWLNIHAKHMGSTDERMLFYLAMSDYTELKTADEDEMFKSFVSAFSGVFESIYYFDITDDYVERLSESTVVDGEISGGSAEDFIASLTSKVSETDRQRFSDAFSYSEVKHRLIEDDISTVSCVGVQFKTSAGVKSCFFSLTVLEENSLGHRAALFCIRVLDRPQADDTRNSTPVLSLPESGDKRKLLVVDDNVLNRKILAKILSGTYEVVEAGDGKEALSYLGRHRGEVSAVLLDLLMPVMDGYTFLDRRGLDRELAAIPVIVLSQEDDAKNELDVFKRGANEFLKKPYEPAIIMRRLENLIALHDTAADRNKALEIIDGIPSGIAVFNVSGDKLGVEFFAKHLEEMLGRNAESFEKAGIEKIVHPDDLQAFRDAMNSAVKTALPFERDIRIIKPDGKTVWLRVSGNPVKAHDGVQIFASMYDVTQQKLSEETAGRQAQLIRRKNEIYENMLANVPCGVITADISEKAPRITFANAAACRICKCVDFDELCAAYRGNPIKLIHHDDRKMFTEQFRASRDGLSGENTVKVRILARNGDIIYTEGVLISAEAGDGVSGVQYAFADVTEHTESENAFNCSRDKLEGLNAKLSFVMNVSGIGIVEYDIKTDTLELSGGIVDVLDGQTRLRGIGRVIGESRFLCSECRGDVADMLAEMKDGADSASCTARFMRSSGDECYYAFEMRSVAVGSDGERSVIGSARDVTEVTRTKQKLEEERRYRLSLTNDSLGYAEYDFVTDRIIDGNLGELFGMANVVNMSIVELRKSVFQNVTRTTYICSTHPTALKSS